MTEGAAREARRPAGGGGDPERWLRELSLAAGGAGLYRAMALAAFAAALVIPQAWLLAAALARIVMEGATLAEVLPLLAPVPVLLALRFALAHAGDRLALAAGARLKARVRGQLIARLLAAGPRDRPPSGELATAVVEGVDALEPYLVRYLAHLGVVATLPLVMLAVILPRDWISGLVLICTAPVIPVFMVLIGGRAASVNRRHWAELARLSGRLLDGLQRLGTLRALGAGAAEADRLARAAEAYRRSTMGVLRIAFLSSLALEFFATVGVALVAVLIGFRLLAGGMGLETGLFVLMLAPEYYAPLRRLGADYHARMEALSVAERLIGIAGAPGRPRSARPGFAPRIAISCERVDFAWEPGRPVLSELSLRFEPGTITAIAGPSGSGKSTLLSVLLGIVPPDAGRVLVDGHDLAGIDPEHWMREVALVPQRPHMFAGSVLDNIRLADPEASLARVREAAIRAAADGFVSALPRGYDTPLGEHGATLSGGQVQRIALARAFLKTGARVLVMDEGAAGLDRATEEVLGSAIRALARERTTILVAHRRATLALADRVIRLDRGRPPRAERDGPLPAEAGA